MPIGYLAAIAITTPWMLYGLGRDPFWRILAATAWQFIPVVVGVAAGEAALRIPSSIPAQAMVSSAVVTVAFAASAFLSSPKWLKQLFFERVIKRVMRENAYAGIFARS